MKEVSSEYIISGILYFDENSFRYSISEDALTVRPKFGGVTINTWQPLALNLLTMLSKSSTDSGFNGCFLGSCSSWALRPAANLFDSGFQPFSSVLPSKP